MERKSNLRIFLGVVMGVTLLLAACAGGATSSPTTQGDTVAGNGQAVVVDDQPDATADTAGGAEEASSTFPDILVLHPDAMDIQANDAAGTYVYVVPGMVAETMDYIQTELKAKGWEPLGQPTVMGHLATLNMQMGKSRVTISMQDNDLSQTTRVQMLLLQQ